jgi:RHS repeat-associated protein
MSFFFRLQELAAMNTTPPMKRLLRARRSAKPIRQRHRPWIEFLEERLVLSTWTGAYAYLHPQATGNLTAWSLPDNWLGGVPSAGNTAEFTDNMKYTVDGVHFTEPLSFAPNLDFSNSVSLDMDSSWTGSLAVDNGVTLSLTGSSVWQGREIEIDTGGSMLNTGLLTITSITTPLNGVNPELIGALTNTGTITFQGNGNFIGGTIDNQSGGLIDIQGVNSAEYPFIFATINNSGTIRRSGNTGAAGIWILNNTGGAVDVESGTLIPWVQNGLSTGGTFTVAGGAILQYGTTGTFTGTYTGSGGGQFILSSGQLNVGSAGANFDFPAGFFDCTGGVLDATLGPLVNTDTMTVAGGGIDITGTIDNEGTIDVVGNTSIKILDTLNNNSGGLIDFQGDGFFVNGHQLIANAGTIRKSSGTGTTTLTGVVENTGTIEADSGTIKLLLIVDEVNGTTLTAGTWNALDGAAIAFPSGTGITTNQASITLEGAGATITGIQGLAANSGNLAITNGASFTTAGDFDNKGGLTLGAGSTLAVAGKYAQSASGPLTIDIGGTPVGGQFGRLKVTASATLAGSISTTFVDGFDPIAGDSYSIVTYASETGGASLSFQGLSSGRFGFLQPDVNATSIVLNTTTSAADLAAQPFSAPADESVGQTIAISYQVANSSSTAASPSWLDSFYLSTSQTLNADAVLLGRVTRATGVAGNSSYTAALSATLPPLAPSNYWVIEVDDSQGVVPDVNRANNSLASSNPILISLPTLAFSTPTQGTISSGQQALYQLTLPAGRDVQINVTSSVAGAVEFYERYQQVPNPGAFDQQSYSPTQTSATITLHNTQAGNYYVLLEGSSLTGSGASYTIRAQELGFVVTNVSPAQGGLGSTTTLTLTGAEFAPGTTISLTKPGRSIAAADTTFVNSNTIYAAFQLGNGLASDLGVYSVIVSNGSLTATDPNAFTIAAAALGHLTISISTPSVIRPPWQYAIATVTYTNDGGSDIPAPLLDISAPNTSFRLADQTTFTEGDILVLGTNPNGPAGDLPPGATGTINVQFQPDVTQPHRVTKISVAQLASPVIFGQNDESAFISALIPPSLSLSETAVQALTSNLDARFFTPIGVPGESTLNLQSDLDADATYLGGLGETDTYDVNVLMGLEYQMATDFGAIAQRNAPGAFGLGVPDPTLTAVTAASGDVSIVEGGKGKLEFFSRQVDGSFQAAPGDFSTLSEGGGTYQVREPDGTREAFNANGSLNDIEQPNAHKLTAGYTGSLLTSFIDSATGGVTTYTYNAQGMITQITDPQGRITTLAYGASGQLLQSTTNSSGTTSFTYMGNAIASITNPDGTQQDFTYDHEDRLNSQSRNGGAEPMTYSYNEGAVTQTDALGDETTSFFNELGLVAEVINPLGQVVRSQFDSNGEPTQLNLPGGSTLTQSYDSRGNRTRLVDPLGNQLTATYNAGFNSLASVTDPLGNTTNYASDPSTDNLLAVTVPNGSAEQYSYNPLGEVTQYVSADGQAIVYTYNSQGLMTSESFPDGTAYQFAYDSHNNPTSATDPTGTTTFTYDSADRLTKVSYPDDESLTFTYNAAGQRASMVDQTGFTVNYHYNALGQLAGLTDGTGNAIVTYIYDAVGRLASKDLGNGTSTDYSYDAAGNVTRIVNKAMDGSVQSEYDYTYNDQGLAATETTPTGTFTYGYDADGQLTSVDVPGGGTIMYQYDGAGNRVAVVDNGTSTQYATNSLGGYTSAGNITYRYNSAGNLVSQTDSTGTTTYSYNALGELTQIVSPASGVTTFQYNALRYLVSENRNGLTTNFLVDPTGIGNIAGQFTSSGAVVAQYTYGLGLTSQKSASGSSAYYSFDATGNTTQLTGASGSILNSYSYLPFGQLSKSTVQVANPFTFVGQYGVFDNGSGLYAMRNRWYDPSQGHFLSIDPLQKPGENLYAYAADNPISLIDPMGLQPGDGSIKPIPELPPTGIRIVKPPTPINPVPTDPKPPPKFNTPEIPTNTTDDVKISADEQIEIAIAIIVLVDVVAPYVPIAIAIAGSTIPRLIPLLPFFVVVTPAFAETIIAGDPNDISGPSGYGTQGFIQPGGTLPYAVLFENEPTASAPAQIVTVTEQLDPNLDWNTFQLSQIGFGSTLIQVPQGLTTFSTQVDATATLGVLVDITAGINLKTGLVTWTFTSLDPTTHDVPADPLAGFLPTDDSTGRGEGFVSYTIEPKTSAETTGAQVHALATVVFDTNAPLNTVKIVNTFETTPPASSVTALPAMTTSTSFNVAWSGSDGNGSGIASYNVLVSDNGGPFQPFLTDTTQTSATFTGQVGHTYRFFSIATSNIGLVQPTPTAAQATTSVALPPPPPPPPPPPTPPRVTKAQLLEVTVVTGHGKHQKKTTKFAGFELIFNEALNPASALKARNYQVLQSIKKGRKTVSKPVHFTVSYNATDDAVSLTLAGKPTFTSGGKLLLTASGITDKFGDTLVGNSVFTVKPKAKGISG